MSLWGRIFAAGYDRMMASSERAGLSQHRADVRRSELPKALPIVKPLAIGTAARA